MTFSRHRSWTLILPLVTLALNSCAGLFPVSTPAQTKPPASETPTIVLFPPTNTPTSFPTSGLVPTTEPVPGVGSLLFRDDFGDAALWNVSTSGAASARVENDRLTLSLTSGPLTIASLRSEPSLGDFYAEVTASASLCRGSDQYGVLFRAAPGGTYYRFILACDGNIRLERVRGGAADILQNWIPSGDAPPGAPAEVKIGVWVVGTEMRFLLNDRLQFSLRDPILHTGTLGFFAYASGATPVIVSFSELEVYSVFYVSPTPSLTPSRTPTPTQSP
ncbi:MAG: hypothetical protein HY781_12265 [Chloroflexi bacterium]|nr:hypothetical protein [Chloroflexota bacterium]